MKKKGRMAAEAKSAFRELEDGSSQSARERAVFIFVKIN